jgi:hypothetical protein
MIPQLALKFRGSHNCTITLISRRIHTSEAQIPQNPHTQAFLINLCNVRDILTCSDAFIEPLINI